MSRPDRTRRARLAALVAVAFLLGFTASPPSAVAQDDDRPDVDQFGGFIASARGNGIQYTYSSPGLIATGDVIFELSVPEALATLTSGPTGYALSSFVFPGPLVADLGAALAAGGQETGIPPYPVRSEAFFPAGPTEARSGDQGTEMVSITEYADSVARTSYAGLDFNPAAFVGGATTVSQTVIEGDQLVSRTRSAVSDLVVLAGLMSIESVVTDIVATSNGTESATSGTTSVSGATVLGLPVTITRDGITFDERPSPPTADDPTGGAVTDALGGVTDPVADGLGEGVTPLNELLQQVGAGGDDALQQLFEASGIEVRIMDPVETIDGGAADRNAGGLLITIDYDGANTPVLTDLLALIPSDDLPSENLGPIPFSPQALVKLLDRQHINRIAVAPGATSAVATPAFEFEDPDLAPSAPPTDLGSGPAGSGSGGGTGADAGGFETATPDLPPPAPSQVVGSLPTSSGGRLPLGDAIPALAVLAVLMGSPFFAAGSSRLADNTLAAVETRCPEGLDRMPSEAGP